MTDGRVVDEQRQWGPQKLENGQIRFQLWAPAETVIRLRSGETDLPMQRLADGWHRLDADIPVGASYAFVLSDGRVFGDPASRRQLAGVDGLSVVADPSAYKWENETWRGRAWEEAVIYEIHIGTFTPEGTFDAAAAKLAYLADLGITAIEIMPVAHFPGRWGWGYDGVLQFAPHAAYGTPDRFKAFIDAAHCHGLMVFLDVVYNHFGPEGNYLGQYAPGFFRQGPGTPWGASIAYEQEAVRQYFIQNALYWLQEFRLDGLRFDAIDQIEDRSKIHILEEIAVVVRRALPDRIVHLTTENPANGTALLAEKPGGRLYTADWNDDFHHALHVAVTGEARGHYAPFGERTWEKLRWTLAHGYISPANSGEWEEPPSAALVPTAFVHFLQNHDQVGNRARGDRLYWQVDRDITETLFAMLLLSPQIPLMFMGDDHLSGRPFRFFADYDGDIATAIRQNRPKEAANFGGLPEDCIDLPGPTHETSFQGSKLDWDDAMKPEALTWNDTIRNLLALRRKWVMPLLASASSHAGAILDAPEGCIFIDWQFGQQTLRLRANLSNCAVTRQGDLGIAVYPSNVGPALPAKAVQFFIAQA